MHKVFVFLLSMIIAMPSMGASLINDTETERVIGELVAPLARTANIPENRMKIHIVNDDDFNAFVMGGEDIYVYTGLLKQIKTPNALQAVIAHELGHTLGGHMAQM
ncbi:MAG: M48 family metallopeptidase, partial [Alphaproteobacteria bacterium]|nr:M48 family metallopeptidase [Alphaproteobacteria bacterium]